MCLHQMQRRLVAVCGNSPAGDMWREQSVANVPDLMRFVSDQEIVTLVSQPPVAVILTGSPIEQQYRAEVTSREAS